MLRTKMKGNTPTVNVITKLMIKAASALSLPLDIETMMDRNIKNALVRSANPTFLDMTLRFISRICLDYFFGEVSPSLAAAAFFSDRLVLSVLFLFRSCWFSPAISLMESFSSTRASSPSKWQAYLAPVAL